jgi:hypothetical protein
MAQVLNVVGHSEAIGFEPVDEGQHAPPHDPLWQESTWVYWGNGAGVGGVVHISQEPINDRGSVFASAYADGFAYRRLAVPLPLAEEVRAAGGHGAGNYSIHHDGGTSAIRAVDEDLEIDLTFIDALPYPSLLAVFPALGDPAKIVSSTSYQVPGRVTGTVRLGATSVSVDAMAQRGHSWGIRDYAALRGLGSRWSTGGIEGGPTYHSYAAVRNDGAVMHAAYVVDDGRVHYAQGVKMVVEFDLDGASALGGRVELDCGAAGRYVFRSELENANQFYYHGNDFSVCFGSTTLDGRSGQGWCAWEIQNGTPGPDGRRQFFLRGYTEDGLQSTSGR